MKKLLLIVTIIIQFASYCMDGSFITIKRVPNDDFTIVRYSLHSYKRDKDNFIVPQERMEMSEVILDDNDSETAWLDNFPSRRSEKTEAELTSHKEFFATIIKHVKNFGYTQLDTTEVQTGKKITIPLKEKRKKSRAKALYAKK